MTGTCKFCAYCVDSEDEDLYSGKERKTCVHRKLVRGYKRNTEPPEDGAKIENDEGWGILVGPNFGCINFQECQGGPGGPGEGSEEFHDA